MRIEKPIDVPLMTIEEKADLARRIEHPNFEAVRKHWDDKPSFPKDFDMSKWDID
jgi:hypothetical protein